LFADNCFAPTPKWRHNARVDWKTPWKGLDMALTWRYIGAVDQKNASPTSIERHFSSYNYIDLSGNWSPTDKVEVRLGIDNITDKDPPINSGLGTTGNGNTYPQAYEIGRYIFGGVQVKF
jgi:outer membrane receptor protein involved in Fe transport